METVFSEDNIDFPECEVMSLNQISVESCGFFPASQHIFFFANQHKFLKYIYSTNIRELQHNLR
jgi:hypothetical protein